MVKVGSVGHRVLGRANLRLRFINRRSVWCTLPHCGDNYVRSPAVVGRESGLASSEVFFTSRRLGGERIAVQLRRPMLEAEFLAVSLGQGLVRGSVEHKGS